MVAGQDFLALGHSSLHSRSSFVFFAISLLVYQLFRQMNGYCIRPSCLAAFSPARILILAVLLASFSSGDLGLIKYHQSRVLLYGATRACMTMQLVRHSSLELLIHSGGVQLTPGTDTGSNPVTSYGRRFVSIGHSNVRGLLRHLPEVNFLNIEQTKLDILTISETHPTENVVDNEAFVSGYQLVVTKLVELSQSILRIT